MQAVDDLAATIEAKWATLASKTRGQNPRSTVEPPRPESDERTRHALAAWQALANAATPEAHLAIERTLGEGGMGVVHLAEQTTLGRKVAVKTLREGKRDRDAVLKLLREAWITGALEHPNVVPIYDVGVDAKGGPQIVLKRIEGVAWGEVIDAPVEIDRRFGAADALEWNLRILAQVCRAVHFAHVRGVLHRDLKPDNVMIGEFGEVYVLDWGIAVALHDDGTGRLPLASEADDMAGTPAYMAPEMLGGSASRLGPATDVYLLGAILHQIVAGKPPHDAPNMQGIIASIILSRTSLPDSVPPDLARIVERALAREPGDRFATADELREAVEAHLRHRGSLRLSEDATRSLERLRAELASGATRRVLYNLLGECRFGYRAALRESEGNDAARDGLRSAVRAVAEWELDQGDAESATLLLDELEHTPPELLTRLEVVRKQKAEEAARNARASALARDHDKSTGAQTRTFLAAVFGVLWIGAPLVRHYVPDPAMRTHRMTLLGDLGQAALIIALGIWARESMTKTAVNRRLYASLLCTPVIQAVLDVALWRAGFPAPTVHWMHAFIWGVLLTMVSVHVERALWPSAVVMLLVFVGTAGDRTWLHFALAFADAVAMINMILVWSPWLERYRSPRV